MFKIFKTRYALVAGFITFYVLTSFLVRLSLYIWTFNQLDFSILSLLKIFFFGFLFDIGSAAFYMVFYMIYLLFLPKFLMGKLIDKIFTTFILFITTTIAIFSFLAEFPFWEEFSSRFNFIAVDYLVYTYEVVENINQSYPLPILIIGVVLWVLLVLFVFKKKGLFTNAYTQKTGILRRFFKTIPFAILCLIYIYKVKNTDAEWSKNLYENELTKNGTYSFVAAYRSNELDFHTFYPTLEDNQAFAIMKNELKQPNAQYTNNDFFNIDRKITTDSAEYQPNVVLICIESFSAEFLQKFGNKQNITPNLDALNQESILFTNLYATGTRTVRGMEALTLCVPPTPGNSIVRRLDNDSLFSTANVFKQKNYKPYFIYGGDGYFDNMNTFFGGQGFTIVDRNRGNPLSDDIKTQRINIEDDEVQFENAWGISDEDIFSKVIKLADENHKKNQKFFNFVMTTSNHKPYSFPENKIDLPIGTREAAVKYTDFAIGKFLKEAQTKPWFANTVFVIVADHCAKSAGKWDINISKHHIPAWIYNYKDKKGVEVTKLASQIDLMPTVFGYLNWNYNTSLYGKDINQPDFEERALIGNYRTLGMLQNNIFTEINDRKKVNFYNWNVEKKEMELTQNGIDSLKDITISYYQTASYRFKHKKMKVK